MTELLSALPSYLVAHLQLVLAALALAVAISLPLGIAAARAPRLGRAVLAAASLIQTVPGLALLAVTVPVLAAVGLRSIGFLPAPHWVERGLFTPGNSVPRFHIVWGTGRELALRLIAALEAHPRRANLEIRFGQRVDELLTRDGAVIGCRGVGDRTGSGGGGARRLGCDRPR